MKIRLIELESSCIICDNIPDGYTFTCERCTNMLPFDFYENESFAERLPNHIPEEQREQYMARYIRKNFRKLTKGLI
jgi:hypothetical protein